MNAEEAIQRIMKGETVGCKIRSKEKAPLEGLMRGLRMAEDWVIADGLIIESEPDSQWLWELNLIIALFGELSEDQKNRMREFLADSFGTLVKSKNIGVTFT